MAPIKNFAGRPPLQTNATAQKHPSLGGSKGYSQDARLMALNQYRTGTFVAGGVGTPSLASIKRWRAKALNPLDGGTILPFRSNGNKRAEVLRGRDMLILSLHRFAWPKSTAAEAAATVARFSHNPRIYSNRK